MAGLSIAMNCPHCGGTLSIREGAEMASCPFCSALLTIEGDDGVRRMTFRNVITEENAIKAIKDWWLDGFIAYDIQRKSRIVESFPIYVPFWKLRAIIVGWVCGEGDSDDRRDQNLRREIPVLDEREWTCIACDPGDLGIWSLKNLDGDTVPYVEGAIPVFDVTTSQTEAGVTGLKVMEEEAVRETRLINVTFRKVDAFPASMNIIYYPVWIVRYLYNDQMYSATVDGITGEVMSGRAPDSLFLRSLVLAAGMAVAGFLPLLCIGLLLVGGNMGVSALASAIFIIALPLGIVIANASYSFFKTEKERTRGRMKDEYALASPVQNGPWSEVKVSRIAEEEQG